MLDFIRRNKMKRKETVDDEAIKRVSKLQRHGERDDFPEMEAPEEYARIKKNKSSVDEPRRRQKKEAREDREKTEQLITAVVEQQMGETEKDK
jgi:hypothetical protein